jgi:hypothetical protein
MGKTEYRKEMVCSDRFPPVPQTENSWNSALNHSKEEKNFRIPFCRTKIEANSQNSVPNHSAEEKTTQNFIPWN